MSYQYSLGWVESARKFDWLMLFSMVDILSYTLRYLYCC
jgi:hypothetical protein